MKALPWILAGVGAGLVVYYLVTSDEFSYAGNDFDGAANRTSAWGSEQRIKGSGGNLFGKAKEGVGRFTGNDELAGEGLVDQAVGTVKDTAGKAAHAVSDVLREGGRS